MAYTFAGQYGPEVFIGQNATTKVLTYTTSCAVYNAGTNTLATLYANRTKSAGLTNPLPVGVADGAGGISTTGNITFWAAPGQYELLVNGAGSRLKINIDPDPAEGQTLAGLTDVAGTPSQGDVPFYNQTTGKFDLVPITVGPEGSAGPFRLQDAADVDLTGVPQNANDRGLVYYDPTDETFKVAQERVLPHAATHLPNGLDPIIGLAGGTGTTGAISFQIWTLPDGSQIRESRDNNGAVVQTPVGPVIVTPPDDPGGGGTTTDVDILHTDTGTGNMQVEYTGTSWAAVTVGSDSWHYGFTVGDKITIRWTGTQIKLYGTKEPVATIASIVVDTGAAAVDADLYSATQVPNYLYYTSPVLANTTHTTTVTVTNRSNISPNPGPTISLSKATVSQAVAAVLPPVMGTPTPLTGSGTFAAGTYKAVGTSVDAANNETNASNEVTVTIAASGRVTFPFTVATGAVKTRIYMTAVGGATATEQWRVAEVTAPTATVTVTDLGSTVGYPPGSNPTVTYDINGVAVSSLTVSSSTGDTNGVVSAAFALIANRTSVAIQDVCVSVRDHTNVDIGTLDFEHLGAQTLGLSPYSPSTQSISLPNADTYTLFVSYNYGGIWYKLAPVRTLIIAQASTGVNPGGSPGANPVLSVGSRSLLPWNSGSQNWQNGTDPADVLAARAYFEKRGKLSDLTMHAQYCNTPAELDGNMAIIGGLAKDCLAVLDWSPGWLEGTYRSTWANIATGAFDSHFYQAGINYANYCVSQRGGRPVVLRLGWEANGNWYSFSLAQTGDSPASYIAGWRRAADQVHAGAASVGHRNLVIMSWSLSGLDRNSGYNPLTQMYPGSAYVDLIGIDFYDQANGWVGIDGPSTATNFKWGPTLDTLMTFCIQNGKYMAVDEWGLHHTNNGADGGDNPAFLRGFYAWLRKPNPLLGGLPNYTNLAYESYFQDESDTNVNSALWTRGKDANPISRVAYGPELHA